MNPFDSFRARVALVILAVLVVVGVTAATPGVRNEGATRSPPRAAWTGMNAIAPAEERKADDRVKELREVLLDVELAWVPVAQQRHVGEDGVEAYVRYLDLAWAIARVACDGSEKPLYPEPNPRTRTGLFLLAQAVIESNLAAFAEDGRCNSATWRRSDEARRIMKGTCDHGEAFTVWQMHVDQQGGVMLDASPQSWRPPTLAEANGAADVIRGEDVTRDRELAARVALHWQRTVPNPWGSAQGARDKVAAWLAKHPLSTEAP